MAAGAATGDQVTQQHPMPAKGPATGIEGDGGAGTGGKVWWGG